MGFIQEHDKPRQTTIFMKNKSIYGQIETFNED